MTVPSQVATVAEVDRALYNRLKDAVRKADDSGWYEVLGHQPDRRLKSRLDREEPLIWIKRLGPPIRCLSLGGAPRAIMMEVDTTDGEGNPLTYKAMRIGAPHDMNYEVRHISFHEADERAMSAQVATLLPPEGFALDGPDGEGPFFFETVLATDVPGLRENEVGGLHRLAARHVWLGIEEVETVPAIQEIEVDLEAVRSPDGLQP